MQNCQSTVHLIRSLRKSYHIRSDCMGDQICIFGFSRGAFTARALAGMLQKVGLLPPWNREQLPFAYEMYAKDDEEGRRLSQEFKQTFSADVRIKFLGVWYVIRHIDQSPTPYLRVQGYRTVYWVDSEILTVLQLEQCHFALPPCVVSRRMSRQVHPILLHRWKTQAPGRPRFFQERQGCPREWPLRT